jgi:4-diphosphocytidyl-2-C-methyl-D-erythritol kinase
VQTTSLIRSVTVQAPGKVNIHMSVGPRRADGYHDLATIFQAISLYDEITVEPADELTVTVEGSEAALLPDWRSNLATQAALLVAAKAGCEPKLRIHVRKTLPVAGGMAGGSADAAATLLACNMLWGARLGTRELLELGLRLGSDVPFMLTAGTAIGRGRGERLTPLPSRGELHWVFAFAVRGLPTADVYAEFDRARGTCAVTGLDVPAELCHAVECGAVDQVARLMHNDFGECATRMQPHLRSVLDAGKDLGARSAILCGTGATCAFLVDDREAGIELAAALEASGVCRQACHASGPVMGPTVMTVY